jgi:hypothetical protein
MILQMNRRTSFRRLHENDTPRLLSPMMRNSYGMCDPHLHLSYLDALRLFVEIANKRRGLPKRSRCYVKYAQLN